LTITAHSILILIALICFAVAAFFSARWPNVNLIAAGLFFLTLAALVP
jgi:hypothetical protein